MGLRATSTAQGGTTPGGGVGGFCSGARKSSARQLSPRLSVQVLFGLRCQGTPPSSGVQGGEGARRKPQTGRPPRLLTAQLVVEGEADPQEPRASP
jgi:hypothetical protein